MNNQALEVKSDELYTRKSIRNKKFLKTNIL